MSQKYVNQCLGDAQWVVRTVYLAHVFYGLSRPIRKKMWFATPTLGEWGGGKLCVENDGVVNVLAFNITRPTKSNTIQ